MRLTNSAFENDESWSGLFRRIRWRGITIHGWKGGDEKKEEVF
ncbi:hypothetical protein [Melghirimyces profundicolus]|nr:hypothetical protein [Melghirimyces profundicolus]